MEFRTKITIPKADFNIGYDNKTMLLGSCFAEQIGDYLDYNKFPVIVNPFGILYNPLSVAVALRRIISGNLYTSRELVFRDGLFHSFMHHSAFSAHTEEQTLLQINNNMQAARTFVRQTNTLLITFGSAYVYRLQQSRQVVGNCHKFPDSHFTRTRLTPDDIVAEWLPLIAELTALAPSIQLVFTVSPIRHWKDGAHQNQLSKATLLIAIDTLMRLRAANVHYFPAYEIMMDELRDYRFYANDMLHPSAIAIDYIRQRFAETYFTPATKQTLAEWQKIRLGLDHRPFNTNSNEYRAFLRQLDKQLQHFADKHPHIDCSEEQELIKEL